MTAKYVTLTDGLYDYLTAHTSPLDEVARDLVAETRDRLPDAAGMLTAPDQAVLLTLLARMVGARQAVEVGTFTGFSALALARGLAPGGRLLCCDVSAEYTAVARRYWARAGVADRIELRIAPAIETLRALPAEPHLDLAFIDADKPGYPAYWAELVPRMRTGGILLADNVFQDGRVADPDDTGPSTTAIRDFNDLVRADDRVDVVMLAVADGLTLARRR
jgi:caffeoyl-CoA O-methyltransferase